MLHRPIIEIASNQAIPVLPRNTGCQVARGYTIYQQKTCGGNNAFAFTLTALNQAKIDMVICNTFFVLISLMNRLIYAAI